MQLLTLITTSILLYSSGVYGSPFEDARHLVERIGVDDPCICPTSTVTKTEPPPSPPGPPGGPGPTTTPHTRTVTSTGLPFTSIAPTSFTATTSATSTLLVCTMPAQVKREVERPAEPEAAPTPPPSLIRKRQDCPCEQVPTITITVTEPSIMQSVTAITTLVVTPTVTSTPLGISTNIVTATYVVGVAAAGGEPTVALARPTVVATGDHDDDYFAVGLPFPIQFYGQSTDTPQVSVNGFIALLGNPEDSYANIQLPDYDNDDDTEYLPDTVVLPLWTDLALTNNNSTKKKRDTGDTTQGIYYQIDGDAPNRNITFEYLATDSDTTSQSYHFLILFQEANPGTVTYTYLDVTDSGGQSTVGAQSETADNFNQFSFDTPDINAGLQLVYDPVTNAFIPTQLVKCDT